MPLGAGNRHRLNDDATPSNSTGDAPEDHARRHSWKQPHTAKMGRRQRAQPSQKGHPHEQPAARKEPTGVTLSYPSNYANAPRAGSARGHSTPTGKSPILAFIRHHAKARARSAQARIPPRLGGWARKSARQHPSRRKPTDRAHAPPRHAQGFYQQRKGNSAGHSRGSCAFHASHGYREARK